jgi:acetolactate synthase I/II/III large subunit
MAMKIDFSRRDLLKSVVVPGVVTLLQSRPVAAGPLHLREQPGTVSGLHTGARALVDTLLAEGVECIYGIPGAQENELWDTMKSRGLEYLLVTHEFSAACMADAYARVTGKPGVMCIVPGPGVTNALTGLGEALLDSIPLVCLVGDVARGKKYRPFQVHDLNQGALLEPVCKEVIELHNAAEIPSCVRRALQVAQAGEPGPVGVVIPYDLLIDTHHYNDPPLAPCGVPWDETAFQSALCLLAQNKPRVGIYAGQGCMNYSGALQQVAELLQAPVATSVSGKGVIPENHPLAVGWGYGPQGTRTAEVVFGSVDLLLAIGVKFSEVSTANYSNPQPRQVIHVDANPNNIGRVLKTNVCVPADAGAFLSRILENGEEVRRCENRALMQHIAALKQADCRKHSEVYAKCGADPMALLLALRRAICPDALVFVDVTMTEHWAAEAFEVCQPRTYFNPVDNQAMGWSIPAAIGAQRVRPGRQVVTVTGDGCMLMSALEMSTAAREGLPVKFFILDDQAYGYMQRLQKSAYTRTTATALAHLDYPSLAKGLGLGYLEVTQTCDLDSGIRTALGMPGPVLTRVVIDYDKRPVRWIEAVRSRFTRELSMQQKVRFASRLGIRSLELHKMND